MTCDAIRELIHEAYDNTEGAPLPEAVCEHVTGCADCRELTEDLAALSRALRNRPSAPLPADALDAVWRETIRARTAPAWARAGVWRFAAAAVFVAALSTATVYFVFAPPPSPPAPSAVELARAEAQAELVLGYTARALAATRNAATDRVLASRVSPAVRGVTAPRAPRRPS